MAKQAKKGGRISGEEIRRTLVEMQQEYWDGLEVGSDSTTGEADDYLLFHLGGEFFGIAAAGAREVLRIPRLARLPGVGEHIPGVISLRGEIVAVTDLRPLLGLSGREIPPRGRLVVVEGGGMATALLAETVEGLRSVPRSSVEDLTEGLPGLTRELAVGQVVEEGGILVLLDLERLLAREEMVIDHQE